MEWGKTSWNLKNLCGLFFISFQTELFLLLTFFCFFVKFFLTCSNLDKICKL